MTGEREADAAASPGSSGVKRKRSPRVTSGQTDALLSFLEARPYLHTRKFTGLQGRDNFDAGWKEVATELNQLPNGSKKTPEQWMTVWRDLKSRASSKAARLRKERVQTGNRAISTAPLTEVECRIVSFIGIDYTFGTECPDSMPEEDIIQCEMETGVSTSEVISLPQTQHSEFEFLEVYIPLDTVEPNGSRPTLNAISPPLLPLPTEQQVQTNTPLQGPQLTGSLTPLPSMATQQERSIRNRNLNPRRSVNEQYSSARRDFLTVAESNAESMRMLAAAAILQGEAAKTQAEAFVIFAKAADKKAEARQTQSKASLALSKAAEEIAEALIKISEKM